MGSLSSEHFACNQSFWFLVGGSFVSDSSSPAFICLICVICVWAVCGFQNRTHPQITQITQINRVGEPETQDSTRNQLCFPYTSLVNATYSTFINAKLCRLGRFASPTPR